MQRHVRACLLLACGLAAAGCSGPVPSMKIAGDPDRGRAAIAQYGCVACHTIPGLPSFGANVGPPLTAMGQRAYLAGVLPHTPDNLVRWLRDPPAVDARTLMPNLGVSAREAADIAAYLYAQD